MVFLRDRRSLLIYLCLAAQLVALSVIVYRDSLAPEHHRLEGTGLLKLKRTMYAVCLVALGFLALLQAMH